MVYDDTVNQDIRKPGLEYEKINMWFPGSDISQANNFLLSCILLQLSFPKLYACVC